MKSSKSYLCTDCGKKIYSSEGDKEIPECCGKQMICKDLDPCEKSVTAEQERIGESDEPCDDGM